MRRISISIFVLIAALLATTVAVAAAPTATTGPATDIGATTATLTGSVDPGRERTTFFFQYGTTTEYGSSTAPDSINGGNSARDVRTAVTGLAPNTTYHYRLVAQNADGTVNGADRTFTTTAAGTPPPAGSEDVTIRAVPNPVTFGRLTTISGRVREPGRNPVEVTLEENPYPFTAGFRPVATRLTAANGDYSFTRGPQVNSRYRVSARTSPPTVSRELLVQVRYRLTLRLSDSTPRRGQLVRFSGFSYPRHDGRRVYIQRRSSTGSYRTVARTTLRASTATRSRFSRRIRIYRDGLYRARVLSDADHVTGTSPRRRVNVP